MIAEAESSPAAAGQDSFVPPAPSAPLLQQVKELLQELPGLVSDRVHLLALELKRSGQALATMLALVVAAAILGVTAWLAMWVGVAGALMQLGLAWGWVLLIVLAVNLGAAVWALMRARSLAHLLTLPATVRRLTVKPHQGVPPPSHPPREHDQQFTGSAG